MQKSKLQYFIWGLCLLILLQTGWIGLRLYQTKQRKIKAIEAQAERLKEQEEQVKEELKSVPEPDIEENLAKGGRLWIEPSESDFSNEFELEIWAEVEEGAEVKRIDLKLFYPSNLLKLTDEEWTMDNGLALWSKEREGPLGGEFIVKTISFEVLESGKTGQDSIKIEFDFNKESLLDCNLLDENGRDVLEGVEGGNYSLIF